MEAKITTGLYIMALADECKTKEEFYTRLSKSLKWLLEPFILEVLTGIQFFHKTTAKKTSWIKYPTEEYLKLLEEDSSKEILEYQIEPGNPTSEIDMKEFEIKNYPHPAFKELKIAMIVENIMDKAIEKLEMRNNPQIFEKLAFLYLAKQVQHKNKLNLNARWWKNVEFSIKTAYSESVFEKVWPKISLTKDEDSRISDCNFAFTNKEMRFVGHTIEEMERVLDEAYVEAYIKISELL